MARTRVRFASFLALSAALALVTGCGNGGGDTGSKDGKNSHDGKPVVVVTTTWEGAFAKAAGAEEIKVIVPQSVHHAPDYDPKPSDLAAVGKADFVLYAPFEPYAAKIKEAAGSKAELVEVNLDNDADKVKTEVARLGELFGTEDAAAKWTASFDTEYAKLSKDVRGAWPGGKSPVVVSQVFTVWSAKLSGATPVGTYGPEAVTPAQLAELSAKKPALVLDNAHMSTGTVLPDSGARQVKIVNYPGNDLDLLPVYRNAAAELKKAMGAS
ncbi:MULTISPECIES: metal ABC transporter solute-binding protein, Zn/Mn family [Streptomyces]|uniref:metal ABC transporter solute-binding protein, Zn/Mn family n=1 Tax=Streptomyces TaxID=1883 RepID=UPI0005648AD2|nr:MULTISPECIES: zinc ABC transporter substrate-binding protein [Streptomyces]AKL64847.1 ABC transporter substrate-binding protein [Streptomyces sp. Mg1]RPK39994.1 Periplasmic solute binding protein family protein [Streptomyces sp. ADI91-18]WBY18765.1 ABC transporter substrate-binding protein [Streptomyces goshikiensis]WSR97460.1 ABC transporter substrate-binding protein [Streptomyces goshikiensis]